MNTKRPNIEYVLVENRHNAVLRFAAKEQYTSNGISYLDWIQRMLADENDETLSNFVKILQQVPMKAYFFETKGVTYDLAAQTDFEFVLTEASYLYQFADQSADPSSFQNHFSKCSTTPAAVVVAAAAAADDDDEDTTNYNNHYGCVFPNLWGESLLIAPTPLQVETVTTTYGHLAAFLRRAPIVQVQSVWKLALTAFRNRLKASPSSSSSSDPLWFSTSGEGVPWLHFRIDPRPKYYQYQPFKKL